MDEKNIKIINNFNKIIVAQTKERLKEKQVSTKEDEQKQEEIQKKENKIIKSKFNSL